MGNFLPHPVAEILRDFLVLNGFVWIWMDLDGFGWIWMDLDGFVWICMDLDGFGWKPVKINENP